MDDTAWREVDLSNWENLRVDAEEKSVCVDVNDDRFYEFPFCDAYDGDTFIRLRTYETGLIDTPKCQVVEFALHTGIAVRIWTPEDQTLAREVLKKLPQPTDILQALQEVMWPGGNVDAEWDSETLMQVANILMKNGYCPK